MAVNKKSQNGSYGTQNTVLIINKRDDGAKSRQLRTATSTHSLGGVRINPLTIAHPISHVFNEHYYVKLSVPCTG